MIKLFKILKYLWLIFSLMIIVWKGVIPGWQKKTGDFNNYYTASKLLIEGKSIHQFYNNTWFLEEAQKIGIESKTKFSPFPPITAYIHIPLTIWKPLTAKRIWLLINIFILIIVPFRIRKISDWSLNKTILFLSLFTIPLTSSLYQGQLYLIIGFILLETLGQSYFKKKHLLIGSIIGLTASLKYIPILFLGYIIQNKKKTSILLYTFLAVVIPSLVIYWKDNHVYTSFFQHFQSHIQGNLPGQGKYAIGFQSIDSLLNNLFVYDSIKNPFPIINASILKPIIKYSLFAGIVSFLFVLFKKNKFQTTPLFVSICIIGIFIMLPASASYHFLLLLFPLLSIFMWLKSSNSKKTIGIIAIIVLITFSLQAHHIPNFKKFSTINLLLHYPRFWGLLCLFLVLSRHYNNHLSKNYG
ncbi:glycosyltransferase 87 family protein [Tenacibaculum sp.]|nr:glycosyltransferase 87 family protein [Tenacibaculum sp.]